MYIGEPHKSKGEFNRTAGKNYIATIRKNFLTAATQQQNGLPIIKV